MDDFAFSGVGTIYFLTDDEAWFNKEIVEDYIDAYDMVLIIIKNSNSCLIKFINENIDKNCDFPWYNFLKESIKNKKT